MLFLALNSHLVVSLTFQTDHRLIVVNLLMALKAINPWSVQQMKSVLFLAIIETFKESFGTHD